MKSLHDYIAEVTAKTKAVPKVAPAKVRLNTKKKSNPYHDPNHAMSHDEEANGGSHK
jgi:hypothetical protein